MDNLRELTQNDIKIMVYCYDKKTGVGLSKANGITVEEVYNRSKEALSLSESKIRSALNTLVEYGYMDNGLKNGRKKSYCITDEGYAYIKSIKEVIGKNREDV